MTRYTPLTAPHARMRACPNTPVNFLNAGVTNMRANEHITGNAPIRPATQPMLWQGALHPEFPPVRVIRTPGPRHPVLVDNGSADRRDLDLMAALETILMGKSERSWPAIIASLCLFLNFRLDQHEPVLAVLSESPEMIRDRMARLLRSLGCGLSTLSDGRVVVTPPEHRASFIERLVRVASRLFEALKMPTRHLNIWAAGDRYVEVAPAYTQHNPFYRNGIIDKFMSFRTEKNGNWTTVNPWSYYLLDIPSWYPPAIYDSINLFDRVLSAIQTSDRPWPYQLVSFVQILGESACRSHELFNVTLHHWGLTNFGKGLRTINKGSHGRLTKTIYFSESSRARLIEFINARHREDAARNPSFDDIREIYRRGDPDNVLKTWYLFPKANGKPYTYSGFRDAWWLPTMETVLVDMGSASRAIQIEAEGETISGTRVRMHMLRHAYIENKMIGIYEVAQSEEERQIFINQLKDHIGWKSDQIQTYAAFFLERQKLERGLDFQQRRSAEARCAQYMPVPSSKTYSIDVEPNILELLGEIAQ